MSSIFDIIYIPIGLVFRVCYMIVENYGLAIILFAFITKLAMFPLALKSERNRIKTQLTQPKMQALQTKYKGNTKDPKYSEELQKLYAENGNPMTGCLWQFIQLPLIWAIWNAIRRPLSYICDITSGTINNIATVLYNNGVLNISNIKSDYSAEKIASTITSWSNANEINIATAISQNKEMVMDLIANTKYQDINFSFCGLDLGATPLWSNWTLIIPIFSGLTSFLVGFISQKIMSKTGIPQAEGAAKTNMNVLLYVMPFISILIGFGFSIAIGEYWIFSNILSIAQTIIVTMLVAKQEEKKKPIVVVKEKKLNYNQIEKMERLKSEQEKSEE